MGSDELRVGASYVLCRFADDLKVANDSVLLFFVCKKLLGRHARRIALDPGDRFRDVSQVVGGTRGTARIHSG
jgi:hypothetical protein